MPGRFFLSTPLDAIAAHFGADPAGLAPDPPRHNVAPGQEIVVCRPDRTLARMRWGLIPVGRVNARGRPVMETIVNARSETVFAKSAFRGVCRCLVPADGWYEWTGKKGRKTAWRIAPRSGGLLAFAAICDTWNGPGGVAVDQVATITCDPSADVRDIHDRMGVLLEPVHFNTWLTGDIRTVQPLMQPHPDGRLLVTPATDVNWDGP